VAATKATPKKVKQESPAPSEPVNEWLPENLTSAKKRVKGKKR
jgi:hypothetical protein